MMAGVSWVHNTEYGFLRTALAGDTLDNSNGYIWDLAWLYRYTNGGLTLTPGIGVEYHSDNYNDYYYGVSHKESRRSGLQQYTAGETVTPYVGLAAKYQLTQNLYLNASAIYTVLPDEVKNSPMIDRDDSFALMTGLSWKF
jgi:outer membrane protein